MKMGTRRKVIFAAAMLLFLTVIVGLPARDAGAADPTFTLLTPLPTNMVVGEAYAIEIQVDSDEPFIWARALGDDYFPGRGAVIRGGDILQGGSGGILSLTVIAKSSTSDFPDGFDPLAIVVGARYPGGQIVSERFDFTVTIP